MIVTTFYEKMICSILSNPYLAKRAEETYGQHPRAILFFAFEIIDAFQKYHETYDNSIKIDWKNDADILMDLTECLQDEKEKNNNTYAGRRKYYNASLLWRIFKGDINNILSRQDIVCAFKKDYNFGKDKALQYIERAVKDELLYRVEKGYYKLGFSLI